LCFFPGWRSPKYKKGSHLRMRSSRRRGFCSERKRKETRRTLQIPRKFDVLRENKLQRADKTHHCSYAVLERRDNPTSGGSRGAMIMKTGAEISTRQGKLRVPGSRKEKIRGEKCVELQNGGLKVLQKERAKSASHAGGGSTCGWPKKPLKRVYEGQGEWKKLRGNLKLEVTAGLFQEVLLALEKLQSRDAKNQRESASGKGRKTI